MHSNTSVIFADLLQLIAIISQTECMQLLTWSHYIAEWRQTECILSPSWWTNVGLKATTFEQLQNCKCIAPYCTNFGHAVVFNHCFLWCDCSVASLPNPSSCRWSPTPSPWFAWLNTSCSLRQRSLRQSDGQNWHQKLKYVILQDRAELTLTFKDKILYFASQSNRTWHF